MPSETTAALPPLTDVIGQERAVEAISFAIEIESPGYHVFALGAAGTGKTTTIKKFLDQKAASRDVPDDWVYVNNFRDGDRPRAIHLPPGTGARLKADMDRFADDLRAEVPRALDGEQYRQSVRELESEFGKRRQELFDELQHRAEERSFTILQTPQGLGLAPLVDSQILTPEQFAQLPEEQRHGIEANQAALQDDLRDAMRQLPHLQREASNKLRDLERRVAGYAVGHLIDDLKQQYQQYGEVLEFLEEAQQDVIDNLGTFREIDQSEPAQPANPMAAMMDGRRASLDQYRVNLFVDNGGTHGAPVVLETNPSYYNLIGRVEHQAQFGALVTNFTMLKAGALHRANGGYLMVAAQDILTKPYAWEALKRALRDRRMTIESMGEDMRAITTRNMEPEHIPLDVKVVLLGDPQVYYLLYSLDEDFQQLFKVKADFATQIDWDDKVVGLYARFVGMICRDEHLRHFDRSGVGRLIEQEARAVESQEKVSTRFGDIVDMVRQANYWAGVSGHDVVSADDVQLAIDQVVRRSNLIEERLQEMIEKDVVMIDTSGAVVGQINGLSVLGLGDYVFGRPTRITARTGPGRGGVVHIDRETGLGGPIHNKGVLILAGYLRGRFAQERPLAVTATLTFEQTYEQVEGDSASSAELYALLSSLSGIPIRQCFAVTGSVNQMGQVQAIGGVNQKIEGFFAVCKAKGLTGDQGVLIPRSNIRNLMLREEVLKAVEAGQFHVYPVATIDEGLSILTGVSAGERLADGSYPEKSINEALQRRLAVLAASARASEGGDREHGADLPSA